MLNRGLDGASAREIKEIKAEIKKICSDLQARRKKMGLTQEKLAESLNVDINTIKYIEQGRRLPSLPMLIRICRELQISFSVR